jgi:hypothetical protein
MKYSVLSSVIFLLFFSCSSTKLLVQKEQVQIPFWTSELRDNIAKNEYRITISTQKANITGILIAKQVDGKWKGTIINEFGIKVLDYESSSEKCKLFNVITFIDKWYIRKTIASDIQFIMEIDNPNYSLSVKAKKYWFEEYLIVNYNNIKELRRLSVNEIEYKNIKRELTYSLVKIAANNIK